MENKIFGIGFQKTGTTSLKNALEILGYQVTGPNEVGNPEITENVYSIVESLVPQFDAFQDNPWPIFYKELDVKYPNSKFILTLRDSKSWIKSMVKHFGQRHHPMMKWIYGVGFPEGNEVTYIKRFEDHNKNVQKYFQHRPEDLLILNLIEGDGWEKLCSFLEVDTPNFPFPHANKAIDREKAKSRWRIPFRKIKQLIRLYQTDRVKNH